MVFWAKYLSLFTAFSIVLNCSVSNCSLGCFSEYCSGGFPGFSPGFFWGFHRDLTLLAPENVRRCHRLVCGRHNAPSMITSCADFTCLFMFCSKKQMNAESMGWTSIRHRNVGRVAKKQQTGGTRQALAQHAPEGAGEMIVRPDWILSHRSGSATDGSRLCSLRCLVHDAASGQGGASGADATLPILAIRSRPVAPSRMRQAPEPHH